MASKENCLYLLPDIFLFGRGILAVFGCAQKESERPSHCDEKSGPTIGAQLDLKDLCGIPPMNYASNALWS